MTSSLLIVENGCEGKTMDYPRSEYVASHATTQDSNVQVEDGAGEGSNQGQEIERLGGVSIL